jgi:hypothetical protein
MLHSEDADINAVISEIVRLDRKALRIKEKVNERVDNILNETRQKIRINEQKELATAQAAAQQKYQLEIAKAENERTLIIDTMKRELEALRIRYEEKKDEQAELVLKTLFQAADESN